MAVVFISPKQRQKMFFLGITVSFLIFLSVIFLIVFFSQPQTNEGPLVFNKPKVNIDFKILDSEQLKNFEPFSQMELQFTYSATNKEGKLTEGLISAVSKEEAIKFLEAIELKVVKIEEVKIGRDNPFAPYSQESVSGQTSTK